MTEENQAWLCWRLHCGYWVTVSEPQARIAFGLPRPIVVARWR